MPANEARALIVGPYRAHNFGDDLVGGIIAKHLQSLGYSVTIPKLSEENSAWLGTEFAEDYPGQFERANIVVLGGGGIMSDTSGAKPGASYLDLVARAGMRGQLASTKVYITSVGAGPWILEKSKMLAFATSLIAERVGVREQESYDHLRGIGVLPEKLTLGADLALLTPDLLEYDRAEGGKLGLQFDVRAFADVAANPELAAIIAGVEKFANAHSDDVVLIRNGKGSSDLVSAARAAERLSYTELETFLPRIAGMRALFTSHLHLAITSYAQRIPTFSVYVREKTRRFYEQIGHPERAIDLRTATVSEVRRFLDQAQTATWTDEDETRLQALKSESRKLLSFIK